MTAKKRAEFDKWILKRFGEFWLKEIMKHIKRDMSKRLKGMYKVGTWLEFANGVERPVDPTDMWNDATPPQEWIGLPCDSPAQSPPKSSHARGQSRPSLKPARAPRRRR